MGHSDWARSRQVMRTKARLGCAKMARACEDFVVCTVAYTPQPHFQSRWPWWPQLMNIPLGWFIGCLILCLNTCFVCMLNVGSFFIRLLLQPNISLQIGKHSKVTLAKRVFLLWIVQHLHYYLQLQPEKRRTEQTEKRVSEYNRNRKTKALINFHSVRNGVGTKKMKDTHERGIVNSGLTGESHSTVSHHSTVDYKTNKLSSTRGSYFVTYLAFLKSFK